MAARRVRKSDVSLETNAATSLTDEYLEFPCITFVQSKYKLVLFAALASTLWQILEINRRVEDKDEGYQRALSDIRVNQIGRFIDQKNALPLSLLITFDEAELVNDESKIRVPKRTNSGWVIDGQHRLAGTHKANIDLVLPVIAFIKLSIPEQIQQFITINREAKG